jgi:hypothetical protein
MSIRKTHVSFALSVDDSGIGWEDQKLSEDELVASVKEFIKRLLTDQIDQFDPHSGVRATRLSNIRVELSERAS